MRKVTKYKVSGVVDTKPTTLPEGLTVTEVSVNLPEEGITIRSFQGSSHRVGESISVENAMTIGGVGLLEKEEVRRLRDFCNKVLGEEVNRVIVDRHNDVWFELQPGRFTLGCDRGVDLNYSRERAVERRDEGGFYVDRPLPWVMGQYGPVKDYEG